MKNIYSAILLIFFILIFTQILPAQVIFQDDFEGTGNINWVPLFYSNVAQAWEENLQVIANPYGDGNVGLVQDKDTSNTGAALVGGDVYSYEHFAIEADVYCYFDTSASTSRYTGIVLMADTSINDTGRIDSRYVKLVADFDKNGSFPGAPELGPRLRLYNNDLNFTTFQYSFDKKFYAEDIPGGIPDTTGWHKLRLEVRTLNADSVAYWCYFDGNLVGGGPVYDATYQINDTTTHHPYTPGTFGLFSFQQEASLPGYFDNVIVEQLTATGIVESQPQLVENFELAQNYPNPFNSQTKISFQIPEQSNVELAVYNIAGQKINNLFQGVLPQGIHQIFWDGKNHLNQDAVSGIYFYTLKTDNGFFTRKMILAR
jgi:hypothetical protein